MSINFPNIDPVILNIAGPLKLTWYSLAYILGILLGYIYILFLNKKSDKPINAVILEEMISYAALGIVLGGRLGYVLFYDLSHFLAYPEEIVKTWKGGMSFHGGLLGYILSMILLAGKHQINVARIFDYSAAAAPIGIFFGRIANFINGELYGRISNIPWAVYFPGSGTYPRHPSQIYEAILEGLVTFIICAILFNKCSKKPWFIAGTFVISYGISRIIVEFFREPDAHIGFIISDITMGQILSLPMIALGAILIYVSKKKQAK